VSCILIPYWAEKLLCGTLSPPETITSQGLTGAAMWKLRWFLRSTLEMALRGQYHNVLITGYSGASLIAKIMEISRPMDYFMSL
jgi:hypothetical protein